MGKWMEEGSLFAIVASSDPFLGEGFGKDPCNSSVPSRSLASSLRRRVSLRRRRVSGSALHRSALPSVNCGLRGEGPRSGPSTRDGGSSPPRKAQWSLWSLSPQQGAERKATAGFRTSVKMMIFEAEEVQVKRFQFSG